MKSKVMAADVTKLLVALVGCVVILFACSSSKSDESESEEATVSDETNSTAAEEQPEGLTAATFGQLFETGALSQAVDTVECTLETGTITTCFSVLVPSQHSNFATGPFCPSTVDDPEHGIFVWDGDSAGLYALNHEFWDMMTAQGYPFADEAGAITVVDPGGLGAGRPSGDACLQATPDGSFTLQALFPVEPEQLDEPTSLSTVSQIGVAVDGVTIFGDAPSGTSGAIPALDPCGGHDDPSGYYHWHFGATGIESLLEESHLDVHCDHQQDPEGLFGIAYDGYRIYGPFEGGSAPSNLDSCSGHVSSTDAGEVYHYHLTLEAPNLPACRVGATAESKLTSPDNPDVSLPDSGGPGGQGGPPGGQGAPGAGPGGPPGGPPSGR